MFSEGIGELGRALTGLPLTALLQIIVEEHRAHVNIIIVPRNNMYCTFEFNIE